MASNLPKVPTEIRSEYLYAFVRYWDFHRRPVDFLEPGVLMTIESVLLSLVWLRWFKADLPMHSLILFRALTVSGLLGLGSVVISWIPPEVLPNVLLILMPARMVNVNILALMALILGLLALYRNHSGIQLYLTGLVVYFCVVTSVTGLPWFLALLGIGGNLFEPILLFLFRIKLQILQGAGLVRIVFISGCVLALMRYLTTIHHKYSLREVRWVSLCEIITPVVLAIIMIQICITVGFAWGINQTKLRDWSNDPLFEKAASGQGILLTCSDMQRIQLRTRRPVLVNTGALDSLVYALESGPEMNRILREVYDIDLLHPPYPIQREASVPDALNKRVWQARSRDQWIKVKRAFGVTEVLTYQGWKLALPQVIHNEDFILYRIPG